jgi:hypothetical protein
MIYIAHYKIYSDYQNESENIHTTYIQEYNLNSIEELNQIIEQEEDNMDWDDSPCINFNAQSDLICTTRELIKVTDTHNNIINL